MKITLYLIWAIIAFFPFTVTAQTITINGKVIDGTLGVLPGASIVEVGTKNIALTDHEGLFSIVVKSDQSKLKVTYLGYNDLLIGVKDIKNGTIEMESSSELLDEVVAIGFGKQRAITNVGATSQISSKDLKQSPSASLQNALVGKMPGLFSQQASGQPGSDAAAIYIRGQSSFTGASKSPLVLIDDIETDFASLSQLNVNEIENISILKDASSTAIFGVKGANGVVLVTTKRGREGAAVIKYSFEYGLQSPTIYNKTLGSYESLLLMRENFVNQKKNPEAELPGLVTPEALEHFRTGDMPFVYPDVNWYDAVMKKIATQTKHNVDVTGGVKNVKYFVSFGYLSQDGIMKEIKRTEDFNGNYYLKRYNIRSNIDIQATKTLKLSLNISGILKEQNEPYSPEVNMPGGAWPLFRRLGSGILPPYGFPVKNEDGSYAGVKGLSTNPLMTLEYGGYKRQFRNDINGNFSLEQKLDAVTKGLLLKGTMALTNTWGYSRSLTRDAFPDFLFNKISGQLERVTPTTNPLPSLQENANSTVAPYINPLRKITSQFILSWNRKVSDHNLSALGLLTWNTSRLGTNAPQNFRGYSGRISYDYRSKYMLEFNAGYNGSDRFKAKKKYGFFPAISAGWNISEEPFLKEMLNKIAVDFIKIRGSYGIVGSDAFSGSSYLYLEEYNLAAKESDGYYYFGENPMQIKGMYPGALGNDNVTWENEKKLDLGLVVHLFNSKLRFETSYFRNERYDILTTKATIPSLVGISAPPLNIGRVSNKGFEMEGAWRDNIANVHYYLKGNVSLAKNVILENGTAPNLYAQQETKGRPIGQQFGYIWDGYYMDEQDVLNNPDQMRSDIAPGDLKYKDISGPNGTPDGVVNRWDIVPIGNPSVPQVTFGMSTGITYKNIDFSVLFQGAAQASILGSDILQIGGVNGRVRQIHQGRWTEDNKNNATFPRLGGSNYASSTFWLRPRDYIRLKNVELGYNLPANLVSKLKIKALRVYANGYNLLTWSNLKLYDVDPESDSGGSAAYSSYPQMKVFNIGLQATF